MIDRTLRQTHSIPLSLVIIMLLLRRCLQPSQGTFYLQNWDSADNAQTAMYYFQLLAPEFIQACVGDLYRMNS